MGKRFLSLFLLAGSLFAADPFVGTWKFNSAQSKREGGLDPGPGPKEATSVVKVMDGQFAVTVTGTDTSGSPFTMKYTVPETGGPLQWQDGGPPPGSGFVSTLAKRKADSHIIDSTDSKDGKVIQTSHFVVSADGKSFRLIEKGTDPQGNKYTNVNVWDKQ